MSRADETADTLAILARLSSLTDNGPDPKSADLRRRLAEQRARAAELPDDATPCPALMSGEFCDGEAHYLGDPTERPRPAYCRMCPERERREIVAHIGAERERLAGALAHCSGGFEMYDPSRQVVTICARCRRAPCIGGHQERLVRPREMAQHALLTVREWSQGKPPTANLIMAGPLGLGKTHLLLAAYFTLVKNGVRAAYVNSTDLREIFQDCAAFDDDRRADGVRERTRLLTTTVICWDDMGDIEGDERRRGAFAEGIKHLLDRGRAVWGITTNLGYEAAQRHPDVGSKAMSRLTQGAIVLRMDGRDLRVQRPGG